MINKYDYLPAKIFDRGQLTCDSQSNVNFVRKSLYMNNPYIIMSAPNGARRVQSDHPKIPITPIEMAKCAEEILSEGASILHLHVRDENNTHTIDPDRYRASITAVKAAVGSDLIIQPTTEAVGIYNRYEQMEMVKNLNPEAVSLALRELCPDEKSAVEFSQFMKWINQENIFPQIILYNEHDYLRFEDFRKRGVFENDEPFVLFVFGSYAGRTPETDIETKKLQELSIDTSIPWTVCGFAENEKECVMHSARNNGHIRVGFENNIWDDDNKLLKNNAEMVSFAANTASTLDRKIADAATVRNIFNLRD